MVTSRRLVPQPSSSWAMTVPGGFLFAHDGKDADRALDEALSDVDDGVDTLGFARDVDPAALVTVDAAPVHPFNAFTSQFQLLTTMEPGSLVAVPVAALSGFSHKRLRFVTRDNDVDLPNNPGLLVPLDPRLGDMAIRTLESAGLSAEHLVGVELLSAPSRRFRVERETVKGPRTSKWSVWVDGTMVGVHPSQKEARADGMLRARSGTDRVEVRPWVSRNDGDPFLIFRRTLVTQRAACKAVAAVSRREGTPKVAGWVFAGRSPRAAALTTDSGAGR